MTDAQKLARIKQLIDQPDTEAYEAEEYMLVLAHSIVGYKHHKHALKIIADRMTQERV